MTAADVVVCHGGPGTMSLAHPLRPPPHRHRPRPVAGRARRRPPAALHRQARRRGRDRPARHRSRQLIELIRRPASPRRPSPAGSDDEIGQSVERFGRADVERLESPARCRAAGGATGCSSSRVAMSTDRLPRRRRPQRHHAARARRGHVAQLRVARRDGAPVGARCAARRAVRLRAAAAVVPVLDRRRRRVRSADGTAIDIEQIRAWQHAADRNRYIPFLLVPGWHRAAFRGAADAPARRARSAVHAPSARSPGPGVVLVDASKHPSYFFAAPAHAVARRPAAARRPRPARCRALVGEDRCNGPSRPAATTWSSSARWQAVARWTSHNLLFSLGGLRRRAPRGCATSGSPPIPTELAPALGRADRRPRRRSCPTFDDHRIDLVGRPHRVGQPDAVHHRPDRHPPRRFVAHVDATPARVSIVSLLTLPSALDTAHDRLASPPVRLRRHRHPRPARAAAPGDRRDRRPGLRRSDRHRRRVRPDRARPVAEPQTTDGRIGRGHAQHSHTPGLPGGRNTGITATHRRADRLLRRRRRVAARQARPRRCSTSQRIPTSRSAPPASSSTSTASAPSVRRRSSELTRRDRSSHDRVTEAHPSTLRVPPRRSSTASAWSTRRSPAGTPRTTTSCSAPRATATSAACPPRSCRSSGDARRTSPRAG